MTLIAVNYDMAKGGSLFLAAYDAAITCEDNIGEYLVDIKIIEPE
jgi:hypothetical protein